MDVPQVIENAFCPQRGRNNLEETQQQMQETLEKARCMATYTRLLFQHLVKGSNEEREGKGGPAIPHSLTISWIEDCEHIAQLAASAYENKRECIVA
jgi:hypothetical protein